MGLGSDRRSSESRVSAYVEALSAALGHADRAAPFRAYCTGLLLPGPRKSVEPMAARVEPARVGAAHQSLHHFVANAEWSDRALLGAVTVSSGSQASGRPPPFRPRLPWRGPMRSVFSGRFGFCPFDGGRLELSGVFGGSPSAALSAAISRSIASSRSNSARISASFSASVSRLRSGRTITGSLNRIARDHVKHFLAIPQRAAGFALHGNRLGDEQIPEMSRYLGTALPRRSGDPRSGSGSCRCRSRRGSPRRQDHRSLGWSSAARSPYERVRDGRRPRRRSH